MALLVNVKPIPFVLVNRLVNRLGVKQQSEPDYVNSTEKKMIMFIEVVVSTATKYFI